MRIRPISYKASTRRSVERPLRRTEVHAAILVRVTVRRDVRMRGVTADLVLDGRQVDVGVLFRARDLDGAAGAAHDALGGRSDEEALETGEVVAADHDQVGADLARELAQLVG